jgi:ABC-type Co2+ transport system permease subunit
MAEIGVTMGPWSIGTVIVRGQLVQVASVGHGGTTSDLDED